MCYSANKKQHNPVARNPLGLREETNASLHIVRELWVSELLGTRTSVMPPALRRYKFKWFLSSSDPAVSTVHSHSVLSGDDKSQSCFARAASSDSHWTSGDGWFV